MNDNLENKCKRHQREEEGEFFCECSNNNKDLAYQQPMITSDNNHKDTTSQGKRKNLDFLLHILDKT